MPSDTAKRMIEAMFEAHWQYHDNWLRKGNGSPQEQMRAALVAALRALAEAGPSDGMVNASYEYEQKVFGPLARGLKHSVIFEKQLAALISEIEQEPSDG